MRELYSGKRIFRDSDTQKQVITPVHFKWDDVLDMGSDQNIALSFTNTEPKTRVALTHGRTFWLLADHRTMRDRWEAYLQGEVYLDDIPQPSDN